MIYFVKSESKIKIGYTKNIASRIYDLQREHGELSILKLTDGDVTLERKIHKKFSKIRLEGEWFQDVQDLRDFMQSLPDPQPVEQPHLSLEKRLGKDIKSIRLLKNLRREDLCKVAGVSMNGLRHLENGTGTSLSTFIRVVQALGKTDWLTSIAPYITINPLDMRKRGPRQRASRRSSKA